jgi:hypothetical protein
MGAENCRKPFPLGNRHREMNDSKLIRLQIKSRANFFIQLRTEEALWQQKIMKLFVISAYF